MMDSILEWAARVSQNAGAAAILIAVARVVWASVGWLIRAIAFYFGRKTMRYGISFGPIDDVPKGIEGVYCQIVRFGTDLYIERMASDQERYEGRLQNKVQRLRTKRNRDGLLIVHFELPVHKRIGTQFKTFVSVRDPQAVGEVEQFLSRQSFLSNIQVLKYQASPRIFFTINMFPIVETVEGIKNNFFYPV